MIPHDVHPIRGPKAGTGTASKAVEADPGPARYLATLIGGTDEQTMRWFILVALLLDLADVLLLLAATRAD